jgi:hypothetical protein
MVSLSNPLNPLTLSKGGRQIPALSLFHQVKDRKARDLSSHRFSPAHQKAGKAQ